jgi:polyphosphate kinase
LLTAKHRRLVRDLMNMMWEDNRQAWDLHADGEYVQRQPGENQPERATHQMLLEYYHQRPVPPPSGACAPPVPDRPQ